MTLFELHLTRTAQMSGGGPTRYRNLSVRFSDKSDLNSVLVNYEDANIVALGIRRGHEKTHFLGIVCLCSSLQRLPIAADDFDPAAVFAWSRTRDFSVFRISDEVVDKENCLENFHLYLYSVLRGRTVLQKERK